MSVNIDRERLRFPPTGTSAPDRNVTARKHQIGYDEYGTLVECKEAILGKSWVENVAGVNLLRRTQPWKDANDELQFAVEAKFNGVLYRGVDDAPSPDVPMRQGVRPKFWDFLVTYAALDYPVGDLSGPLDGDPFSQLEVTPDPDTRTEVDRYCTMRTRSGVEIITPKDGVFWYGPAGQRTSIQTAIPYPVPFQEFETTWWRVPAAAYPRTAIAACRGKVNATPLTLPEVPGVTRTYAAGEVYFEGEQWEPAFQPDSGWALNVRYHFRWRGGTDTFGHPVSWNAVPSATGEWVTLYRGKDSPNGIHQTAELNDLFKPEPP